MGWGSSGHILLHSIAQASKLFSVLQRVLLGTTPLAVMPNCYSNVGEPNQEETGSVLPKLSST